MESSGEIKKYLNIYIMVNKYAFVWLLMKGDRYLPGVLLSAYSIKRNKTENDLVIMDFS